MFRFNDENKNYYRAKVEYNRVSTASGYGYQTDFYIQNFATNQWILISSKFVLWGESWDYNNRYTFHIQSRTLKAIQSFLGAGCFFSCVKRFNISSQAYYHHIYASKKRGTK